MSVLIKGMEMPECCDECRMRTDACFCSAMPKEFCGYADEQKRPDWCPLVALPEKHGRLIDGDALVTEMTNGIRAGNLEDGYEKYQNINNMDDCVECVKYADVVIEAEGEE